MDSTRYLYEVRPRKPVRIPGKRTSLRSESILLTKDEVKEYMKSGAVYRRATNGKLERVTGANLDQLHRPFNGETNVAEKKEVPVPDKVPTAPNPQPRADYVYNKPTGYGNSKKDNKHHGKHGNGKGDERGKTAVSNSAPQPQFNNNETPSSNPADSKPMAMIPGTNN